MTTRRMDDRDIEVAVRGWLREPEAPVPDRVRKVGRVMGHVDATGQRRRWWPLIPFTRRPRGQRGLHRATAPAVALASLAAIVVGAWLLLYASSLAPPIGGPGTWTVDPADRAAFEGIGRLWSGSPSDEDVAAVYAADAVHTVLWTDRAERIWGVEAIAARIRASLDLPPVEQGRLRLPDSSTGEHRYLAVRPEEDGGWACVIWIADGLVTRHDCILPMAYTSDVAFEPGAPPAGVSRAALAELARATWGGDRSALDQVIAPDVVHLVAYDNATVTREGIDEYWATAALPGRVTALADAVDLPAPEGELRWADFNNVAGGSLCTFWARGDRIIRHDCIVPMSTR